ncbi:uncharacterized protein LOC128954379 [Oppia nitens]|uniref:uncharacterized protein LOC128954379 n=1 Tax=Oppia nitens TaxID=1686743 RepID=UPI0023DA67C4|nr:uncharacterized protein LOC128954379 [Oppia nitens]
MTTTTAKKKDSFDRFGDDLCQLLLQYLPIDDRLRLQSVSKQWLTLIFITQTDLVFDGKLLETMSLNSMRDYYPTIRLFKLIVRKCPNITAVTINVGSTLAGAVHMMNRFINLLTKNSNRLKHLSIKFDYYDLLVIGRMFDQLFWRFGRQLQTFKFDGNNHEFNKQLFYKVIDGLPNLKTLDITNDNNSESTVQLNDIFIDNNMYYLLPKSLQSLNIKLDELSMPLFRNFANNFGHQLISLTIQLDESIVVDEDEDDEWSVNLKPLLTGFRQMPRLRQLKFELPMDFGPQFTVNLFSTIGRNCRQLKSIDYSPKFSNILTIKRIFAKINKHMSKQLRQLTVDCSPDYDCNELSLTSRLLNRLHGLTHLTLRLDKWQIIGNQFFQDIHRNLPRLQYLYCDRASITRQSIASIGQLTHLTDVYLLCDRYTVTLSKSYIKRHLLIGTKIQHLFIEYNDSIGRQLVFKCGKYFHNNYQINSTGNDVNDVSYDYNLIAYKYIHSHTDSDSE